MYGNYTTFPVFFLVLLRQGTPRVTCPVQIDKRFRNAKEKKTRIALQKHLGKKYNVAITVSWELASSEITNLAIQGSLWLTGLLD